MNDLHHLILINILLLLFSTCTIRPEKELITLKAMGYVKRRVFPNLFLQKITEKTRTNGARINRRAKRMIQRKIKGRKILIFFSLLFTTLILI